MFYECLILYILLYIIFNDLYCYKSENNISIATYITFQSVTYKK